MYNRTYTERGKNYGNTGKHKKLRETYKADLCLEVKGSSMVDAGINGGDYALIRKDFDFINGRIYAVRINSDCEVVLKKVNKKAKQLCYRLAMRSMSRS